MVSSIKRISYININISLNKLYHLKKFLIPDPPTSPTANLIPIIFVIGVTAIKQVCSI